MMLTVKHQKYLHYQQDKIGKQTKLTLGKDLEK